MCWFCGYRLEFVMKIKGFQLYWLFCLGFVLSLLSSCGQAYFPIELKTVERSKRYKGQENMDVTLVAMTKRSVKIANNEIYKRRAIDAGDLSQPAKVISLNKVFEALLLQNGQHSLFISFINLD